jgi:hypothetical protein
MCVETGACLAPSAGTLYPLELRVAVGEVAGLAPGEEPLVLLPLGRHLEGR